MEFTAYFRRRVLQQRPYIRLEWCEQAVQRPAYKETQPDGRIRHWIYIEELGKYLRVITLEMAKRSTMRFQTATLIWI